MFARICDASWKRKIVANLPTSNDLKNAWISYLSTLVDDFGFVDVDEGTGTFLPYLFAVVLT